MTTLRDQFALAALPALQAEKGLEGLETLDDFARRVYRVADALVAASVERMPGIAVPPEEEKQPGAAGADNDLELDLHRFVQIGRMFENCLTFPIKVVGEAGKAQEKAQPSEEDTIKKEIVPDPPQDFIALVQGTFSSFRRLAEHCPYKRPDSSYCYHPKNAYSCTIKCPVLAEMESELI